METKIILVCVFLISVLFFLTGCDPCYFQEGQNIKVVGKVYSNVSNGVHNDTCDKETFWVVVNTNSGCTLNVLAYEYDSCAQGKQVHECLDRSNSLVNLKGIYGKVKVYGDYGMRYYDVTPYSCAENTFKYENKNNNTN